MDTIKFILFSIIVLVFFGLVGYWALVNIQSGTEHASIAKLDELKSENETLKKRVSELSVELSAYKVKEAENVALPEPAVTAPQPVTPAKTETPKTPTTAPKYKNQTLIDELQKLVNDKITMKQGSAGTRVGTVQKFLNLYNKTSNRVDNDYGASTVKAVTAFQKDQGLTADGVASTSTFNKMIDWLKKQG